MEKIDKISKSGNLIFIVLLYTGAVLLAGAHLSESFTLNQIERRYQEYDWYEGNCFDRTDVNYIFTGYYE